MTTITLATGKVVYTDEPVLNIRTWVNTSNKSGGMCVLEVFEDQALKNKVWINLRQVESFK